VSWDAKWPSSRPHPVCYLPCKSCPLPLRAIPQASVSCISSYGDLRGHESVSPPFTPPSAIRAEQPRSRLPYPTGDYASPSGSVVAGQGALSPPQSPPTTSNSGSASPAGGVADIERSHILPCRSLASVPQLLRTQ
jgi:hypothetical protein